MSSIPELIHNLWVSIPSSPDNDPLIKCLQDTEDYVIKLEAQNEHLWSQNEHLWRLVSGYKKIYGDYIE